jgi:hypothetical protein
LELFGVSQPFKEFTMGSTSASPLRRFAASPLVIVLVAGALFAKPPLPPGEEPPPVDSGLDTVGSDQPGKITPATPAPNDCGHPPRMHSCAGGVIRIRMGLQQNVPVGPLTSRLVSSTESLKGTQTKENRTCSRMQLTFTVITKVVNSYTVSGSLSTGVSVEIGANSAQYLPVILAAKTTANSAVTITGALSRDEEFSFQSSASGWYDPCLSVTEKVYWTKMDAEATQDFATIATCNIQGGGEEYPTECDRKTIKATSVGTITIRSDIRQSTIEGCCPSPPAGS